ncbi:MAG: hypothetical protein ACE5DX_05430 [Candidatus Dojkabacteria bacterium]
MAIYDDLGQLSADLATAISNLPATGGKIWIGAGTEEIATAVDLVDNLYIKGAGIDLTTLKATASITAILQSDGGVDNVIIEDITIDVDSQASTAGIQLFNGASTEITFRRCKFKNTVGSWQLRVGYAAGSVGSPGSRSSNTGNLSTNIRVEDCIFDTHTTTTLEQAIFINSEDVDVEGCVFQNNSTAASNLIVYAFSKNVRINDSWFNDPNTKAVTIQQSDFVNVTNCDLQDDGTNFIRCIDVVNCAQVVIEGNKFNGQGSAGSGSTGVAIFDATGATFESGVYTALYQDSLNISVDDNSIDGMFQLLSCPNQTGVNNNEAQTHITCNNNNAGDLEGLLADIGGTDNTGVKYVTIVGNTVNSFKGDDTGIIRVLGGAGGDVQHVVVSHNTAPVSGQGGSNAYGILMDKVDDVIILGNDVEGKGSRAAITLTDDTNILIKDNQTNETGLSFAGTTGVVKDNIGTLGNIQELETIRMQNKQGATINPGETVILVSQAPGDRMSLTTTTADERVLGVAAETIANDAYGHVHVRRGKITTMKVDGTIDIAIGDYLTPFTTGGIARKASSGELAHAIAMEAYTTNDSNGVLDALVIEPRQAP